MEDPLKPSLTSVAFAPTKPANESVYGFQNLKALQQFCSSPPEQNFKLRIHFPFQSFESLEESGSCNRTEQSFYETLYDTEDFKLLPKYWLWKRDGKWRLKIDQDSVPGTSRFEEKEDYEAVKEVEIFIGLDWESKVSALVTLKTRRVQLSPNRWVDFTSWARWKIGYYAVQTVAFDSSSGTEELEVLSKDQLFYPIPSKGMACLKHVIPTNFNQFFCRKDETLADFVNLAEPFITSSPKYGEKIDGYDSSDEEGDILI